MKKLAMIGCGGIGEYHLSHFLQFKDIELAGFCDLIPERAQAFAEKAGSGRVFTDYRAMYDEIQPDMVFLCIPPYCHGEIERETIRRRIPFFVEKPVTLDLKLAKELRDEIAAAGLITASGFQCRYSKLVAPTNAFIKDHQILYINCTRMGGIPGMPWWRRKDLSGGQIVEQTIHQFDIIRYCFGEPESVFTYTTRGFIRDVEGYDTDDLSVTAVRFENGTLATVSTGCYVKDGAAYDSKIIFSAADARGELSILSKFDVYEPVKQSEDRAENGFVIRNDGAVRPAQQDGFFRYAEEGNAGVLCDRTFIDAVLTGDGSKIRSPYADAVKTLEFVMACNQSAETGLPVRMHFEQ